MITYDCKKSPEQFNNNIYPIHSASKANYLREETDDYHTGSSKDQTLIQALQQSELKALRKTASGQIARLYQVANLFTQDDPVNFTATELNQLKQDIQNATAELENTLHAITNPLIDDPEPGEDEIAR